MSFACLRTLAAVLSCAAAFAGCDIFGPSVLVQGVATLDGVPIAGVEVIGTHTVDSESEGELPDRVASSFSVFTGPDGRWAATLSGCGFVGARYPDPSMRGIKTQYGRRESCDDPHHLDFTAVTSPACQPPQSISVDEAVWDTISVDDCWGPDGMISRVWTLTLDAEQHVPIEMVGSWAPHSGGTFNSAAALVIEDGLGTVVAEVGATNVVPGRPENVWTGVPLLPGGAYRLVVKCPYAHHGCTYRLTVGKAPCAIPVVPIAFGSTIAGNITIADCWLFGGRFKDTYRLELNADTNTFVDHYPRTGFGAYVQIRNDQDSVIAESSGEARITRMLPAGVYEIDASTSGVGMTGRYELTVSAPGS